MKYQSFSSIYIDLVTSDSTDDGPIYTLHVFWSVEASLAPTNSTLLQSWDDWGAP